MNGEDTMHKLTIEKLNNTYGKVKALTDFSYIFTPGIYGILGANGAGKSTLFGLLTDTLHRQSGEILWDDKDILKLGRGFRKELGYMPQSQGYYPEMSAREFLFYIGELKGIPRKEVEGEVDRMLTLVGLKKIANRKLGQYSGGMRQRALLASAMLGSPSLLILDEPTAGVDPRERIRIRSIISEISQDRIVLLATHVVTDVECIANQVLLMKKGKLVLSGSPEELIVSMKGKVKEKLCTPEEIAVYQKQYGFGSLLQRQDGQVLRLVGDRLPENFTPVSDVGLEEVYLYYCTGKKKR